MDNICGDLDFEEGGNPVVMNRVLGFLDPVLCDAYVCDCMGYSPDDVEYIRLAEALGVPLDRLCRDKDAKRETFRTLADVAAGFLLLERKGLVTQVGTHWQGPNPGDPVLYEDEVDPQNPGEACRWADFSVRSDALAGFFAQLASLQAMERQNPSANLRAAINGWILSELPGLDKISLGPQEDREVKS